jgi:hypothetical protein
VPGTNKLGIQTGQCNAMVTTMQLYPKIGIESYGSTKQDRWEIDGLYIIKVVRIFFVHIALHWYTKVQQQKRSEILKM